MRAAVAHSARVGEGKRVIGTAAITGRVSDASRRAMTASARKFGTGKDRRAEGKSMRGCGRGRRGIEEVMIVYLKERRRCSVYFESGQPTMLTNMIRMGLRSLCIIGEGKKESKNVRFRAS
jgi:hypothetical protein